MTIEFSTLVSFLILLPLILVFPRWLFYNQNRETKTKLDMRSFEQCPYCSRVFFAKEKKDILSCPHCRSLMTADKK